ncbi:unnamed protein product [Diatraea saccharalis]|uniref:Uncharacterized protein n=1 Tax=Diatraea saccharalis TaxID=40085 RepID=A0A9N9QWI4_9NEOP|nr:unnamed protein product [Diatraea saccharalis]
MVVKLYCGDGASLSAAGSKRSALSASDAECFSLCLGAGPLCASSLTGSSESIATDGGSTRPLPHPQSQQEVISKILERKDRQPTKIEFKIFLTENTMVRWEAVSIIIIMY